MKIQTILANLVLGSLGFSPHLQAEQFYCIGQGSGIADLFPGEGDFSVNGSIGTQDSAGIINIRNLNTASGCYVATLYPRSYAAGEILTIETVYDFDWAGFLGLDERSKTYAQLHIKLDGQTTARFPLETAAGQTTLYTDNFDRRYVRARGANLQVSTYAVPSDGSYSFEICEAIPRSTVRLTKLRITNTQNQDCTDF